MAERGARRLGSSASVLSACSSSPNYSPHPRRRTSSFSSWGGDCSDDSRSHDAPRTIMKAPANLGLAFSDDLGDLAVQTKRPKHPHPGRRSSDLDMHGMPVNRRSSRSQLSETTSLSSGSTGLPGFLGRVFGRRKPDSRLARSRVTPVAAAAAAAAATVPPPPPAAGQPPPAGQVRRLSKIGTAAVTSLGRISVASMKVTAGPMPNVEDEAGADEASADSRCAVPTLHPQSVFRLWWDCLILLLMLYTTIVLPMTLAEFAFMHHGAWLVVEQTINCFFLVDLLLNLHTGYVNESRVLVMDAQSTRIHYLRTWFVPDAIATVPVDLIYMASVGFPWDASSASGMAMSSNTDSGLALGIKCLRLLRMFRLLRLRRILARLEIRSGLQTSTRTAVTFAAVVFCASHWYCCAWFLLGITNNSSWVTHYDLRNTSAARQYVASFYWSLSTMSTIAYGDITPQNSYERMFACFVMVMGTSVYAYGVASVVTMATGANQSTRDFIMRKDELFRFMRQMHMPKELSHQLREYFIHYQAAMATFHEKAMLQQLSPHLQAKVTGLANAGLIRQVPFFQKADERCVTAVVLCLNPHLFVPEELICYQGEVGREMYIIKSGEVQVYLNLNSCRPDDPTPAFKELARLTKGQFFGEMALLKGEGARRNAFIRATTYSIIYSLAREALLPVLAKYDSLRHDLEDIATKRELELQLNSVAPPSEMPSEMPPAPASQLSEPSDSHSGSPPRSLRSSLKPPFYAEPATPLFAAGEEGAPLMAELRRLLADHEAAALSRHTKLADEVKAIQTAVAGMAVATGTAVT